jgi:hypothetical protein
MLRCRLVVLEIVRLPELSPELFGRLLSELLALMIRKHAMMRLISSSVPAQVTVRLRLGRGAGTASTRVRTRSECALARRDA